MPNSFGTSTVAPYIYSIYANYHAVPDIVPPADISNLSAAAGDGQISLSWTNPADMDFAGVKILRRVDAYPGSPTDGTVVYDGNGTAAVDQGLSNGTTYYYRAFTYDAVPNYSSGVTVYGTPEVLETVGNTTVFSRMAKDIYRQAMAVTMPKAGELQSISLYHQAGSGLMLLAVYADAAGRPRALLGVTNATPVSSTQGWQTVALPSPVSVSAGQTIWLAWVFQKNPGIRYTSGTPGCATSSAFWSGGMPNSFGTSTVSPYIYSIYANYHAVPDIVPPANVSDLSATAGDGQISLSWTNPADMDFAGVKILRRVDAYPGSPTDGTVVYDGNGTAAVDQGLSNGTTYYYRAFTYDAVPNYSSGVTVYGTPEVLETVGNTTVFSRMAKDIYRQAMAVTMPKAGELRSISLYHQAGSGLMLLAVYADAAGRPGALLGVTNATPVSSTQGWQTVALPSPVSVSAGQTIWLAWVFQKNPGIRYTSGTPGCATSSAFWSGGMPNSFGTSTVSPYIYSIYANYHAVPDIVPPADVSDLSATAGDGQISLSWTNPADMDFAGVKILRRVDAYPGSPTDGTVVYDGNGTAAVDQGLSNGTTYYYRAFTYDAVPNYSNGATVYGTPEVIGTVGNTTVFSWTAWDRYRQAMAVTMPKAGELRSISLYHQAGSGLMLLAVYADAAGKPSTLLGVTNATPVSSTQGWQTVALPSPVSVSAGQTIWLAWVFQNNPGIRFTSGSPGRATSSAIWSGGMPNSFGISTVSQYIYSIYANYHAE